MVTPHGLSLTRNNPRLEPLFTGSASLRYRSSTVYVWKVLASMTCRPTSTAMFNIYIYDTNEIYEPTSYTIHIWSYVVYRINVYTRYCINVYVYSSFNFMIWKLWCEWTFHFHASWWLGNNMTLRCYTDVDWIIIWPSTLNCYTDVDWTVKLVPWWLVDHLILIYTKTVAQMLIRQWRMPSLLNKHLTFHTKLLHRCWLDNESCLDDWILICPPILNGKHRSWMDTHAFK